MITMWRPSKLCPLCNGHGYEPGSANCCMGCVYMDCYRCKRIFKRINLHEVYIKRPGKDPWTMACFECHPNLDLDAANMGETPGPPATVPTEPRPTLYELQPTPEMIDEAARLKEQQARDLEARQRMMEYPQDPGGN